MISDDLWMLLGIAGFGVTAYCYGKENGVKQTTAKYEVQTVIDNQQRQIDDLLKKLSILERYNTITNNNNGLIT